jgi:hypothetical protein
MRQNCEDDMSAIAAKKMGLREDLTIIGYRYPAGVSMLT